MASRAFLALLATVALAAPLALAAPAPAPTRTIVAVGKFALQPNGGPVPNITIGGSATLTVVPKANATLLVNVTGGLQQITRSHLHWVNLANPNSSFTLNMMPLTLEDVEDLNPPVSFKGAFSYVATFPAAMLNEWISNMKLGLLFVNFKTVAIPAGAVWAPFACKSGCV